MLDHSLYKIPQAQVMPVLDHSPDIPDTENLLENYLLCCKVEEKSPKTLDTYKRRLEAFAQFKKPSQNGMFSTQDIRLYLLSLHERKLNPCTINAYYRVLKTFFNWQVREGFISKSPMELIKAPRIPKTSPKPFSQEDIARLLSLCAGNNFLAIRNRAIILLFLDTGLRLAELASIQLSDIDFNQEIIRIMGKGSKERIVRIGKITQKALLKYLLVRRDNYPCLWVTEERTPLARAGVQIAIKRLCHRAKVNARPGPHTFRHTAAINYLRNGGGEFTLQVMLGHSTLQMTRRYVSTLGEQDMIKAHRKFSPVDNMNIK